MASSVIRIPTASDDGCADVALARPRTITERRRADPQRDRIRLGVLAEVGLLFTSQADERETLQRVTAIAVPALADACKVLLSGPTGLECVTPLPPATMIAPTFSQISVPLLVHDDVIGVLILIRNGAERAYDKDDLVFAEELARRLALYVDHVRLAQDQLRLISELEQSNRELDRFADVASHDLKAPLRGIGHLATWIEEDCAPYVSDGARTHLQLLRSRVRRLEDMIEGILRYSRAGRIVDDPVDVDVLEMVSELVGLLEAPPTVSIVVDDALPKLHTVRIPLQQVFLNLMSNALGHATPNRGALRIEIGGHPTEDGWEFFVRDDGPGIPEGAHEQIWQMFKTLRSHESIGAGIGLSIVRRIVEAMGRRAWVESRPGEGATFRFTWPGTVARWRRSAPCAAGHK